MNTTETTTRPRTESELIAFLQARLGAEHDYETSAQALVDCAEATFNYAAHVVGATGFQASWAALKLYGKIEGIDCPFGMVKAENMLFPQYPRPSVKTAEWEVEWADWAKAAAIEKLAEERGANFGPHPNVWAHWLKLAGDDAPEGLPTAEEMQARWDAKMSEVYSEGEATSDA